MTENRTGGTIAVARSYETTDYVIDVPVTDTAIPLIIIDCQHARDHIVQVSSTQAGEYNVYGRIKRGLDVNDLENVNHEDGTWSRISVNSNDNVNGTIADHIRFTGSWRYLLVRGDTDVLTTGSTQSVYYRGTS